VSFPMAVATILERLPVVFRASWAVTELANRFVGHDVAQVDVMKGIEADASLDDDLNLALRRHLVVDFLCRQDIGQRDILGDGVDVFAKAEKHLLNGKGAVQVTATR